MKYRRILRQIRWKKKTTSRMPCSYACRGGVLRVECSSCSKGQSLEQEYCLASVLQIMAAEGTVHQILLGGHQEVSYSGHCIDIIRDCSEILRSCNGLSYGQSYDDCSSCESSPRSVCSRFIMSMISSSVRTGLNGALVPPHQGNECHRCISATKMNLSHMQGKLSEIERRVNYNAFHILEEGSNG